MPRTGRCITTSLTSSKTALRMWDKKQGDQLMSCPPWCSFSGQRKSVTRSLQSHGWGHWWFGCSGGGGGRVQSSRPDSATLMGLRLAWAPWDPLPKAITRDRRWHKGIRWGVQEIKVQCPPLATACTRVCVCVCTCKHTSIRIKGGRKRKRRSWGPGEGVPSDPICPHHHS